MTCQENGSGDYRITMTWHECSKKHKLEEGWSAGKLKPLHTMVNFVIKTKSEGISKSIYGSPFMH